MADDSNNDVGGVSVGITGDYSQLKADFTSAQTDAAAAGDKIADAFNGTAATGVDALTEAMVALTGAMGNLGGQVEGLSSSMEDYTASANKAGEASDEAETGLAAMAEQMLAVGEALAITEGLRELGAEALSASDSIATATIALKNITGSGEAAEETIKQLETLGVADGLAMPSLLTAAQRMSTILPAGTDVIGILGHLADAAAQTGGDILTAAQKFDTIVNSGNASARALTLMGISMQDLANGINQVNPALNATADSATDLFKTLDKTDQIAALQDALGKLAGTAAQVAQQTFGGQWQSLATSWEQIMKQAGDALLPVISGITDFTKTDILPFLQGLIDDWKELSQPMQEAAVAVALAVAAMVPLTGALAATGLAVSGLSGLLPALDGLLGALGLTAATTATEEAAATVATVALGEASETASVGIAAAGTAAVSAGAVVGGVLAAALVSGAILWADWKTRVDAAQSSVQGIIPQFDAWLAAQVKAASTNQALEAAQDKVNEAFANGLINAKEYAAMVAQIDSASKALLATYVSTLPAITILTDSTLKATSQHALLSQALSDAQANLAKVETGYQANTSTAQQLLAAQTAVTTAQTALNASMGPTAGSLEAIDIAAQKLANSTGNLVSSQQLQANETAILGTSLDLANTAYATSVDKVALLVTQVNDATAAYKNGTGPRQAVIDAEENLQKAYAASQKASDNLDTTVANYATTMAGTVTTGQKAALSGLEDIIGAIDPAMAKFLGLDQAMITLSDGFKNAGVEAVNIGSGPLVGLQSALDEAKAKVAALSAEISNGVNVGQQYEKALTAQMNAQIALDAETAALGTGVSTNTDKISLLTVAVAEAQAKVNDLTTAVQNGVPVQNQLLAAENNLTSAQKNLNTAIGDSATPLAAANTGIKTVTSTAQDAIPVMGELADKMGTVGAQAKAMAVSVASAVDDVTAAIDSIAGTSAGFSGSGRVQQTGFGSLGQPIYSVTASIPPETLFKEAMDAALAAADQQSNPNNSANPLTVAQEALAEATAALKVDQTYFGQTNSTGGQLVSVSALQSAQAAVATAQKAIDSLTGGSTGSVVLAPGETLAGIGTAAPAPASTSAATETTTDTSAYGGSYPGVVAHQAAGEVWVVDTSGVASGGGTPSSSPSNPDAASALAATSTASTVGAAADTMADITQTLMALSGKLIDLTGGPAQANVTASYPATQLASGTVNATGYFSINGTLYYLVAGQLANGDYNGLAFVNGIATGVASTVGATTTSISSGSLPSGGSYNNGSNPSGDTAANTVAAYQAAVAAAAAAGVPYDGSVPWDGKNPNAQLPHAQVPGAGPTSAGGGVGTQSISVMVDARGIIGGNAQQFAASVTSLLQKSLTQNLFAAGARLTQA